MTIFRQIVMLAALFVGAIVAFQGVDCPIDESPAYWTGTTKTDKATAKLLKLYRCLRGHEFWLAM